LWSATVDRAELSQVVGGSCSGCGVRGGRGLQVDRAIVAG